LDAFIHTLHVVLAGIWLGGLVFTTAVVSPALKAMKWGEAERIGVRSVIGRRYARVGAANLGLLLLFAVLDGVVGGFGTALLAEYFLLAAVFGLAAAHGAYFGRRLKELAEAERRAKDAEEAAGVIAEKRRALGRLSLGASVLNLTGSSVVAILAVLG
jgi:putative copper export protein